MSHLPPRAKKIMVVRHGEKPYPTPKQHSGVNVYGAPDKDSLIPRGWERAGALATLFDPSRGPLQSPGLATPNFVYAAAASSDEGNRPTETVTPVSKKLKIKLNLSFSRGDEQQLVDEVTTLDGVVLIGWEHGHIPLIGNLILGNKTTVPQKWPSKRFDMVWVFDLQKSGSYTFSQVPQLLLHGDSPDPIPVKQKKK